MVGPSVISRNQGEVGNCAARGAGNLLAADGACHAASAPSDVIASPPQIVRALITGKCGDVGRIKGPILRGLAARAPYFHNGAGASLAQVVAFYNRRFEMGLTDHSKRIWSRS